MQEMILPLDAFVRSIGVRRTTPHAVFLGAGASVSSGIPSAETCTWEWKRSLFLTKNPGVEKQFADLSDPSVRRRIQEWLDSQGQYPKPGTLAEYGFYIRSCFPIPGDRRAFFQNTVRSAYPHLGYRLPCHLAQGNLVRSVWSTNFDGLVARAAASFSITPIEVGIDTQNRLPRQPNSGELLCVSMHGDYRYDDIKNTSEDLQQQERILRSALIDEIRHTPLIVCGYSGRDQSIMDALHAAYKEDGTGVLFWCGYGDGDITQTVASLLADARANSRQAYYVPTLGFDDLFLRLSRHCLEPDRREAALRDIAKLLPRGFKNGRGSRVRKSALDSGSALNPTEDTPSRRETDLSINRLQPIAGALVDAISIAERAYTNDGQITGVTTGLIDLDRKLDGLHRGELIVLAGRPSMGKTALAINIAANAARAYREETTKTGKLEVSEGAKVVYFSLEMSADHLGIRVLAERTGISPDRIRRGEVREDDFPRFVAAAMELSRVPFLSMIRQESAYRRFVRTLVR